MIRSAFIILLLVNFSAIVRTENSDVFGNTGNYLAGDMEYVIWKDQLVQSVGIPKPAFDMAVSGYLNLKQQNLLLNDTLLTIIDFSKPSVEKRLYIIDLKNRHVVKSTLVAHGMNSGLQNAESFSNALNSKKSSLGLYLTQDTYQGKHGYSLRLEGMNKGLNDNAAKRAVVIHGADYVSEGFIRQTGRIGRSFGCPALPMEETTGIIDLIKNGSCLFIYHPTLDAKVLSDQESMN